MAPQMAPLAGSSPRDSTEPMSVDGMRRHMLAVDGMQHTNQSVRWVEGDVILIGSSVAQAAGVCSSHGQLPVHTYCVGDGRWRAPADAAACAPHLTYLKYHRS